MARTDLTNEEMVKKLDEFYEFLDKMQETELFQRKENAEPMWELGEIMGSVDNIIDFIKGEN